MCMAFCQNKVQQVQICMRHGYLVISTGLLWTWEITAGLMTTSVLTARVLFPRLATSIASLLSWLASRRVWLHRLAASIFRCCLAGGVWLCWLLSCIGAGVFHATLSTTISTRVLSWKTTQVPLIFIYMDMHPVVQRFSTVKYWHQLRCIHWS